MAARYPSYVQAHNLGTTNPGDINLMTPNPRGRPHGTIAKPANLQELIQAAQGMAVKHIPRHYKTKPKGIIQGPSGPSAHTREILPQYAKLFAERDELGASLTLQEIGNRMGVSREMVRIIRKRYFPELGSIQVERHTHITRQRVAKRFANPTVFRRMVRQWLAVEGYFQCGHCLLVKCTATDRTKSMVSARCKWCTADGTWRWWQTDHGKRVSKAWVKANPNKTREYTRRHAQKLKLAKQAKLARETS